MGDVLIVERKEDMSPNGYLRLLMEPDGDIIVHVGECDPNGEFTQFADVQFCTLFGGGGRSPKTHAALRELMLAMAEDNQNGNESARGAFVGEDIVSRIVRKPNPAPALLAACKAAKEFLDIYCDAIRHVDNGRYCDTLMEISYAINKAEGAI